MRDELGPVQGPKWAKGGPEMVAQGTREQIPRRKTGKIMREKRANHPNPEMKVAKATEITVKA